MKKILVFIVLITLIIFTPLPQAYAADVLYRMLHTDEVKSFQKDQDALIVGQLIEKNKGVFKVKVIKVLSGNVNKKEINVLANFKFGWGKQGTEPKIKDYCVMSLKKDHGFYKKAWGAFRASSGDYKTLQLSNYPVFTDLVAIQWYVNSGGKDKDFYFERNSVFVSRPNASGIKIYPQEKAKPKVTIQAERSVYTPAMSSTPGIPLSPQYNPKEFPANLEFIWETERGILLRWQNSLVKTLGKKIINTGERVYWSVNFKEKIVVPSFKVYLKIRDAKTKKVLAETSLKISTNKGFYIVIK